MLIGINHNEGVRDWPVANTTILLSMKYTSIMSLTKFQFVKRSVLTLVNSIKKKSALPMQPTLAVAAPMPAIMKGKRQKRQ